MHSQNACVNPGSPINTWGEITQREISGGMHGVPTKIAMIQAAKDETIQGVSAGVEGRDMSLIHSPVLSRGSAGMRTSVDGRSLRGFSTFLLSDSGSPSPPALPITE